MKPITAPKDAVADLAKVRLGSPFRERIVHAPQGRFRVVQGKDIGPNGALNLENMVRVAAVPGRGEPDVLHVGEVVLQTRGSSYRAAIIPRSDVPMVAAGSLYILTPDASRIDPEFLVFYLNLPTTQAALRQLATGSFILNFRRSAVEQLEVPLPGLSDQRRLVELGRLVRKQADIAERLNQLWLQELHALAIERANKTGGAATPPASSQSDKRKRPQTIS